MDAKVIWSTLLPILGTGLLVLISQLLQLGLKSILSIPRLVLFLISLGVGIILFPAYIVWIVFVMAILLIISTMYEIYVGPKDPYGISIIGVYTLDPASATLRQSAYHKALTNQFVSNLYASLSEHPVSDQFPIVVHKSALPPLMYTRMSEDALQSVASRHVKRCGLAIWAICDDADILRLGVHCNDIKFYGFAYFIRNFVNIQYIVATCKGTKGTNVNMLSVLLAQIIGMSFTDELNDSGRWRDSLHLSSASRRKLEDLTNIYDGLALDGSVKNEIVAYRSISLLPLALRQQALAYATSQNYELAFDLLHQATAINPFWPYGFIDEYRNHYSRKYVAELIDSFREDSLIENTDQLLQYYRPPSFPTNQDLLCDFVAAAPDEGQDWLHMVDRWFISLKGAYPKLPIIYIHWGDLLRVAINKYDSSGKQPPLEVIETAIRLYEHAVELDSTFTVMFSRASALHMIAASYYSSASPQYNAHIKRFSDLLGLSRPFYEEYLPLMLIAHSPKGV